jgi:hypothetical protein
MIKQKLLVLFFFVLVSLKARSYREYTHSSSTLPCELHLLNFISILPGQFQIHTLFFHSASKSGAMTSS